MFKVCDDILRILSEWPTLAAAKAAAKATAENRKREYPGCVFFVCDPRGAVVAGY